MRATCSVFLFAALSLAAPFSGFAQDSISEERIERLFRPPLGANLALSLDGRYIATTEHVGKELMIDILDSATLKRKSRLIADEDQPLPFSKELKRAELRFLGWAAGNRIVFAPAVEIIGPSVKVDAGAMPDTGFGSLAPVEKIVLAPIAAADVDGGNPKQLVDMKDYQYLTNIAGDGQSKLRTSIPEIRGFMPGVRENLFIETASDVGNGIPATVYQLNVNTGKRTVLFEENMLIGNLFTDWTGRHRLNELTEKRGHKFFFEYQPVNSKRWVALPEPPGGKGHQFDRTVDNFFEERSIPLGFDFDPNVLIYASNVGRDTFGVYGLNLTTRQRTALALEHPHRDMVPLNASPARNHLVFDEIRQTFAGVRVDGVRPTTLWVDRELAEVQRTLEEKFPQRTVQIETWSEDRTIFLLRVTGGTERGRIFLYRRAEGLATELMRATPWLANAELHDTRFFSFPTSDGGELTGYLTVPRKPRINPPPLIVWLATGLPPRPHPEFDPQAQVLADMGFVVCRLNQRGVSGVGAKHRDALRRDLDNAPAQDIAAAIDWVAGQRKIDNRRIALLGEGFAAHLALRTAELNPGLFRSVVVFDPVMDLAALVNPPADLDGPGAGSFDQQRTRLFLEGGGVSLHEKSVTSHLKDLTTPVFVVNSSTPSESVATGTAALFISLKLRGIPYRSVSYNDDFTLGLPAARARVYRAMEEFLHLNLYNFDVKIGPTKVIK